MQNNSGTDRYGPLPPQKKKKKNLGISVPATIFPETTRLYTSLTAECPGKSGRSNIRQIIGKSLIDRSRHTSVKVIEKGLWIKKKQLGRQIYIRIPD